MVHLHINIIYLCRPPKREGTLASSLSTVLCRPPTREGTLTILDCVRQQTIPITRFLFLRIRFIPKPSLSPSLPLYHTCILTWHYLCHPHRQTGTCSTQNARRSRSLIVLVFTHFTLAYLSPFPCKHGCLRISRTVHTPDTLCRYAEISLQISIC